MLKDLKNILEVIDDLKATNLVNVQILRKALIDINSRIEEISDGEELIFVRNALSDFKQTLDTKFNVVFDNINTLKESVKNDEFAAENAELMEDKFRALFEVFDSGIRTVAQKVDDIEKDFSNVSQKNIEAAKEEFDKLSKELSSYQYELIASHKANEENLTEQFSSLKESLKLFSDNVSSQTNAYKAFVDEKTAEIRDFIEQNEVSVKNNNTEICATLEGKFKELEETNLKFTDDLEIVKGALIQVQQRINDLNKNDSQVLAQKLNTVSSAAEDTLAEIKILQDYSGGIVKALNNINDFIRQNPKEEFIEEIKNLDIAANVSDLFEKLVQDQFKSMFSIFDSSVKLLVSKVDGIEDSFARIADANLKAAKEEFSKLSNELQVHQNEILETSKEYNDNTIERFSFVAESIKLLSENINIQTELYKDFAGKKTVEIQEFIENNEKALKEDNSLLKGELEVKFKELEDANIEFTNDLETIKSSITEILNKAEVTPQQTSEALAKEFKLVNDTAQDTLAEIKVLQDYSGNIIKSVNTIIALTEKNQNADIIEAIKSLDIQKNVADLFEKVDIFNNNFNIKTEFLEDQILEMKTMFSDISIDIQNKEAELLQRESQRVKEYYQKIEEVSDSLLNLEESLKISGVEYKEHIITLNKELTEFIEEFNTIYNEISSSAQIEIGNSLEELKQFISVNSSNYNDKLVIVQEQFTQAFKDLYEALKTNNFELIESGLHVKDMSEAQTKLLESLDAKIDVIAAGDPAENLLEISEQNEETHKLIKNLDSKVDGVLKNNVSNTKALAQHVNVRFDGLDSKMDVLAAVDYAEDFDEISDKISDNKTLLDELHAKLDVFVSTSDNDLLEDELQEIKDIILEQRELLTHSGASESSLANENIEKVLAKIDGISKTIDEHDDNSAKIKEDLVNTIVSVFSSSNFVEETEEIKDFVEEKTGELSKQLVDVKSKLDTIKQNDISDYSYTLADVESDIAKLRQVINDMSSTTSSTEINQISRNIHNLTSSIDAISKNLTPAEIYQLKTNILKLNDDILSISSRTNKLLLNSDESQKTISDGLLAFSHIAYNLEERMNELSNKEFNAEMAAKLEKMQMLLENAASMDNTFHQVLMFLGEWVDAASNTFESINDKADEINEVSEALSELRKVVPEKFALIDLLEERFEEQQSRMDRLESKLDELTEMTKMNSNLSIVQKVDKMESLLSTLNANVEKLTSYVD